MIKNRQISGESAQTTGKDRTSGFASTRMSFGPGDLDPVDVTQIEVGAGLFPLLPSYSSVCFGRCWPFS